MTKKQKRRSNHHTGAAGTLAVASELSRRGYDAAITLANTPTLDILCSSPDGVSFTVQVKSASSKNWVRVREEHLTGPVEGLFFVVVLIPDDLSAQCVFHILTHAEVCESHARQPKTRRDGRKLVAGWEGLPWRDVAAHEGQWKKLPS